LGLELMGDALVDIDTIAKGNYLQYLLRLVKNEL